MNKIPPEVLVPFDIPTLSLARGTNILDIDLSGRYYDAEKIKNWTVKLLSRYGPVDHISNYRPIELSVEHLQSSSRIPLSKLIDLTKRTLGSQGVNFEMGEGLSNSDIAFVFASVGTNIQAVPDDAVWKYFWYLSLLYLVLEPATFVEGVERISIATYMFNDIFGDMGLRFTCFPILSLLNRRISIAKARPKTDIQQFRNKILRSKSLNKETKYIATNIRKDELIAALELSVTSKVVHQRLKDYVTSGDTSFKVNGLDMFSVSSQPFNSELFFIGVVFLLVFVFTQKDPKVRTKGAKFTLDFVKGILPSYEGYCKYVHGSTITLSTITWLLEQNQLSFHALTNILLGGEEVLLNVMQNSLGI